MDIQQNKPLRTHRVGDLASLPEGSAVSLAGRWEPDGASAEGGFLSDETGRVAVGSKAASPSVAPGSGDLIALRGVWRGESVEPREIAVLHRASAPPPWERRRAHPPGRLRAVAGARKRLYSAVRSFFDSRGFQEVETPLLLASPALQSHIVELTTSCREPGGSTRRLYLSTSPEHAMKRLLAAGFERLYQIAPFFRDGELTDLHAPAFTGLEWYEAYTDYRHCMRTTEALVAQVADAVAGSLKVTYRGRTLDLTPPWERLSVAETFAREVGLELDPAAPVGELRKALLERGVKVSQADDWESCFFKAYIERVEPSLGRERPTFLFDWPISLAAMARPKAEDPRWCERFEVYAAGLELGNAFSELTDAREQSERFEAVARARAGQEPDELLLEALAYGLPPTSGMAMGLDRLLMVLTDAPTIADVLLFPPHYEWGSME